MKKTPKRPTENWHAGKRFQNLGPFFMDLRKILAIFDENTWEMGQILGRFGKCRVLGHAPRIHAFFLILGFLMVQSCFQKNETGPAKIHWDREVCPRCRMAVSDHYFSAQIRGGVEGKRAKVFFFDDLGCAILWLEEKTWKESLRTEIWVNEYTSGEWIEARTAAYVLGQITPMDYRLGATRQKTEKTLDYGQAVRHVFQLERERNAPNKRLGNYIPEVQNEDTK